ncbi:MAG: pyridoxine 5'-phosphate synthase [Cytophagales bacterium]|nr:MAG: pyridoxine 5'-phosphate synthase [Cytophagales bacterium]
MVRLSVNINKIATIRNARGGNNPDLLKVAIDCERFGAQGITVHPRPDERHIRYQDVIDLKKIITTEFNIEGNPNKKFIELVEKALPNQVTLVPDADDAITSNAGWDTIKHKSFLTEVISHFKSLGIRTSIFLDPKRHLVDAAKSSGTDRIELYTEPYAKNFDVDKKKSIQDYIETASYANEIGLSINAGHDLDLNNLKYFKDNIPSLVEVSIGHALICDALYLGLENAIQMYLAQLKQ